jgi:hypothetical protein
MSLIDEALKRAQAAGQGETGRTPERPWIPTPLPDAGLARRRRFLRVAGIAFLLAAAGVAALWWVNRETFPPPPEERRNEESPLGSATAAPTPAPRASAPLPADSSSVTSQSPALPSPRREAPDAVTAEATETAPDARIPPRPAYALADGKTYAGSVALPGGAKIELGGIVYSETQPVALLNDRVLRAGSFVEGFEIKRIGEDRVELDRDGLTIFLALK